LPGSHKVGGCVWSGGRSKPNNERGRPAGATGGQVTQEEEKVSKSRMFQEVADGRGLDSCGRRGVTQD